MTKRHKSFGVAKRTPDAKSDLSFELGDETFKCKAEMQGAVILDFISAADEGAAKAGARVLPFFDEVLQASELERFHAYLKSDEVIVEMETLSDIVGWLIGEYTTRPTKESEQSDDGS